MRKVIDEPLPFRILTVALLIAGYVAIYRPSERQLIDLQIETHATNDRAAFGENLLARRDMYERAAERMRTELSGIKFDADGTTMMATFLDDLEDRTRAHGISMTEIVPQHVASAPATVSALTVHVRGNYQPIIAFLNDVGAMHTLVRLDALKITRVTGDVRAGQTPVVDATIDASLVPVQTEPSRTFQ